MKQLLNTNIFAIEVPIDAKGFNILYRQEPISTFVSYSDDGGYLIKERINYDNDEYNIIGTCTKDECTFDASKYVEEPYLGEHEWVESQYKNYMTNEFDLDSYTLSFYSLLKASGVTLENKVLIIQKNK
jgi:hypothetical protein